jgi:DNA-binding PadR family transcriptional regulator
MTRRSVWCWPCPCVQRRRIERDRQRGLRQREEAVGVPDDVDVGVAAERGRDKEGGDPLRLTPTSYIVLGLLAEVASATPYELKAMVAAGIGNLWSLQHTQLYAEPERLTNAGYLTETREEGGRRRKSYSITPRGREALSAWLTARPTDELPELRDVNLLKVFFGADPRPIAARQAAAHQAKLREYEELEQARSRRRRRPPR